MTPQHGSDNSDIKSAMIEEQEVEETKGTLYDFEGINTVNMLNLASDKNENADDDSDEEYNFKKFQDLIQQIEQLSQHEENDPQLSIYQHQNTTSAMNKQEYPQQLEALNQVLMPINQKKLSLSKKLVARNAFEELNSSRQVVMTKLKELQVKTLGRSDLSNRYEKRSAT